MDFVVPKLKRVDIEVESSIKDILNISDRERNSRIIELNAEIQNDK